MFIFFLDFLHDHIEHKLLIFSQNQLSDNYHGLFNVY